MKWISFTHRGQERVHFGALIDSGDLVVDLNCEASGIRTPAEHLTWFELDGEPLAQARALVERLAGGSLRDARERRLVLPREDVRLRAPVPRPGKLICIGLNYKDHAAESGMDVPDEPVVFSKFPTSVASPGDPIVIPETSRKVDYEAELGVVIGKVAKGVSSAAAMQHVLGYTNVNDVSARDFQFKDGQWQRGKSCDTFAPMGEFIATPGEIPDPHVLRIRLHLNGRTMQDSNTNQLIFGVPELVAFLSQTITLEPGDVIATGTPPGVGFARKPPVYLADGDDVVVDIEGLGRLSNPVRQGP